jgi:hypothetical protein
MQYKYEKADSDYSDLASGRVFYNLPGYPAFPVRLASEIFQRCLASREELYQTATPCTLYDPCCGAAYDLSVIAYLHRPHIREIMASDIDEKAVAFAERNLGLLHVAGLEKRIHEIITMLEQYHKDSHRDALQSAYVLRNKIADLDQGYPLTTKVFQASATDNKTMLKNIGAQRVDIIFTDVPYGQHSQWHDSGSNESSNPIWLMLDAILGILSSSSIVAIASDKGQKVFHERYQRIEHFQIGKRRVVILKPV